MARQRVEMHRLQEFVRLHRLGKSGREVARLLKMGRATERKYREALLAAQLLEGDADDLPDRDALKGAVDRYAPASLPPQQASSAARWEDTIEAMLRRGAGPRAIYDCLRLRDADFKDVSLSAVKRLCVRMRKQRGIEEADVAIPVETTPGEVAQVDFGYAGKVYGVELQVQRKAWLFVMVLGFSRKMVAFLVFDQKIEAWLECHMRAFKGLRGVPKVVVPDNLKAAVIRAAFAVDDETTLNRSYRELARHYGFTIDPTPPRSPEKKGKVEAGVKYARNNFLKPRDLTETDSNDLRRELACWIAEVADVRVHGTTGERPIDLFEQLERGALLELPKSTYVLVVWKEAKVHPDSHVLFEKKLYSVPFQNIGKQVWIRATAATIEVYLEEKRIATHARRCRGYRSTNDAHLPEHRAPLRHRSRDYWTGQARLIGPQVERFVDEVFGSDDVLSKLRVVQSVIGLLKQHPHERANAACRRALHFGNHSYRALKNILLQGLDLSAADAPQKHGALTDPLFARSPNELLPETNGE